MPNFVSVSEVLAAIETDLPDTVLENLIAAGEHDVIRVMPSKERPNAPVATQGLGPTPIPAGTPNNILTFTVSVRNNDNLRIDGVLADGETFTAIVPIPADDTTTVVVIPITAMGPQVADSFGVRVSLDGLTVTIDTQTPGTSQAMTFQTFTSFDAGLSGYLKEAVIELVKIRMAQDGLSSRGTGDYRETRSESQGTAWQHTNGNHFHRLGFGRGLNRRNIMAEIILAIQDLNRAGITPMFDGSPTDDADNLSEGTVDQYLFQNNERVIVWIKNGADAGSVTIETVTTVDGFAVPDRVVAVPASGDIMMGPFPRDVYNDSGRNVKLLFATVETMQVAIIRLP